MAVFPQPLYQEQQYKGTLVTENEPTIQLIHTGEFDPPGWGAEPGLQILQGA